MKHEILEVTLFIFDFVMIRANAMVDAAINRGRHDTIKDRWGVDHPFVIAMVKRECLRDLKGTLIHEVPGATAEIDKHLDLT